MFQQDGFEAQDSTVLPEDGNAAGFFRNTTPWPRQDQQPDGFYNQNWQPAQKPNYNQGQTNFQSGQQNYNQGGQYSNQNRNAQNFSAPRPQAPVNSSYESTLVRLMEAQIK